jgi:hypothetical protein
MYGENGALLRSELSALLAQHRVQLRLGGGGSHSVPVTTSRAEREEIGMQIRRYRQSVLVWCQQASRAVAPYASSNLSPALPTPFRLPPIQHGGLASLRLALDHAVDNSSAALPGLDELVDPNELALVEHWRQAARAAALGEHDFDAGLHHDSLDVPQAHTLIGDIAAVVRALVVLDQRYRSIPGWERLHGPERLGWSALACALDSSLEPPSYAIDALGWRVPTKVMPGPARPGLLGVLQAERNLAVRLRPLPSAMNLRRIVHSQRVLSDGIAELAANVDDDLRARCLARQETYADLQRELRNVGSLIGTGELAVADSAHVIGRLKALRPGVNHDLRVLRAFVTLFQKVDGQIADHVEIGIERNAYLRRVTLPRLVEDSGQLVTPVRERFTPFDDEGPSTVAHLARERLRPSSAQSVPTPDAGRSRAELHSAIVHLPRSRGGALGM